MLRDWGLGLGEQPRQIGPRPPESAPTPRPELEQATKMVQLHALSAGARAGLSKGPPMPIKGHLFAIELLWKAIRADPTSVPNAPWVAAPTSEGVLASNARGVYAKRIRGIMRARRPALNKS